MLGMMEPAELNLPSNSRDRRSGSTALFQIENSNFGGIRRCFPAISPSAAVPLRREKPRKNAGTRDASNFLCQRGNIRATRKRRAMAQAEETIVHNLIDALEQLHQDLDKVELWAAALGHFQTPAPDYQPCDQYILRSSSQSAATSGSGSTSPRWPRV
jgi:hypothetical protein